MRKIELSGMVSVCRATCALLAVCLPITVVRAQQAEPEKPLRFEVAPWVDHFDFAMFFDSETEQGMAGILDHVAETGANVQFFRSSGNSIRHPSAFRPSFRVEIDKRKGMGGQRPVYGWVDYNRAEPDLLKMAFRLGRERGMRPYIHWPFEECHAPGYYKAFMAWNMDHPQFWGRLNSGQPWLGRVGLCYPEVIDYKLAILDELLERGAEGIFIDTFRAGTWGPWAEYMPVVTQSFEKRYGRPAPANARDPEWCQHVADYVTELFRRMREHLDAYEKAHGRHVELLVGVAGIAPLREPPEDSPMLYRAADWRAWVDMGLIDTLVMHSIDWDPKRPFETYREYGRQVMDYVDGRCKVHWPVSAYSFRQKGLRHLGKLEKLSQAQTARRMIQIAWEEGAAGISLECVDFDNYRLDTRKAIAEITGKECRFAKPWTTRGTAPKAKDRRIRPRPVMAEPLRPPQKRPPLLEELPAGPGNNTEVAWSPDGRQLAFQSDRGGKAEIHVLDLGTGTVRRVDTGPGFSMFPRYTPDGKQLVYTHGHVPKTAFQTIVDAQPGWNGRRSGPINPALTDDLPGINIWRLPVAGGRAVQLTNGRHWELLPTVMPDGKSVLLCSAAGAAGGLVQKMNSMFVQQVGIGGGERKMVYRLAGAYAMQPTVSPDGQFLVFARITSCRGLWHLMLSRMDNPSFAVRLTDNDLAAYAPRWSPDGKTVAFTGHREGDSGWQIYLLKPAPGAVPKRVVTGLASARSPEWAPDGKWLAFEGLDKGRYQLFRLPASALPDLSAEPGDTAGVLAQRPRYASDIKDAAIENLFDGDTKSQWQIQGLGHWVEIGFDRAMTVSGIDVHHGMLAYYKNPSGEGSVKGYRFQAWEGTAWKDVIPPVANNPRYKGQGEAAYVAKHRFDTVRSKRFRLVVTDSNDTGRRISSPDKVCVPLEKRVTYLRELVLLDGKGKPIIH